MQPRAPSCASRPRWSRQQKSHDLLPVAERFHDELRLAAGLFKRGGLYAYLSSCLPKKQPPQKMNDHDPYITLTRKNIFWGFLSK